RIVHPGELVVARDRRRQDLHARAVQQSGGAGEFAGEGEADRGHRVEGAQVVLAQRVVPHDPGGEGVGALAGFDRVGGERGLRCIGHGPKGTQGCAAVPARAPDRSYTSAHCGHRSRPPTRSSMSTPGRRAAPRRTGPLGTPKRPARWRLLLHNLTRATPSRIALGVFTALIGAFTVLLSLPAATTEGVRTDFTDALFTAVSAICVTGLVTVETGTHWSTFGLTVIMIAIKLGGLGLMTVASLLSLS